MHNNQSSYNRWSWIVTLILALILLWMLLTGRGPSNACCGMPAETVAPVAEIMPVEPDTTQDTSTEVFSFTANNNDFTSIGDGANVAWLSKSDGLKALLSGEDLRAQGDDKNVTLSGIVDSLAMKQQKGEEAQAFFGPDITVDNQLVVKAGGVPIAATQAPAAKLYFETAKTNQPAESVTTLAPIIAWLNAHPESKAIISGFHDSRGSKARNEQLAKNRAQSTYDALVAAGIDAASIEMRKPAEVEGGSDLNEARRVEISVE